MTIRKTFLFLITTPLYVLGKMTDGQDALVKDSTVKSGFMCAQQSLNYRSETKFIALKSLYATRR
jgi:hypothetical protein